MNKAAYGHGGALAIGVVMSFTSSFTAYQRVGSSRRRPAVSSDVVPQPGAGEPSLAGSGAGDQGAAPHRAQSEQ